MALIYPGHGVARNASEKSDLDPEDEQQFIGEKRHKNTSGTACANATVLCKLLWYNGEMF